MASLSIALRVIGQPRIMRNVIVVTSQAVVTGHRVLVTFGAVAYLQPIESTCFDSVWIRVNCIFGMYELRFKEYDSVTFREPMAACAIPILPA